MIRDDDDFHRHEYRRRKPSWLSVGLTIGLIVALYWLQGPADAPWKNPPVVPARPDAASAPRATTTGPRDRSTAAATARGSQRPAASDNARSGRGNSVGTSGGRASIPSTSNESTINDSDSSSRAVANRASSSSNSSYDSNDSIGSNSSSDSSSDSSSGSSSGSGSGSSSTSASSDIGDSRGTARIDRDPADSSGGGSGGSGGSGDDSTGDSSSSNASSSDASSSDSFSSGGTDSGTTNSAADSQSTVDPATPPDTFTPSADTTAARSRGGSPATPVDRVPSADPLPDLPAGGLAASERASSAALSAATTAKPTTFGLVGDRSKDGPYSRIVPKVVIRDLAGKVVYRGEIDLRDTLKRIDAGKKLAFPNDGSVFQNREQLLPKKSAGYYREWVHRTPGLAGPGPQRVVTGANGEAYYTPDHYNTFRRVR